MIGIPDFDDVKVVAVYILAVKNEVNPVGRVLAPVGEACAVARLHKGILQPAPHLSVGV